LGPVGVLVLIHQQVTDAPLPGLQPIGLGVEQAHRQADQVVEVHRVVGPQAALVVRIDARHPGLEVVLRPGERLIGGDEIVLPA
jgi:hypothetical protein